MRVFNLSLRTCLCLLLQWLGLTHNDSGAVSAFTHSHCPVAHTALLDVPHYRQRTGILSQTAFDVSKLYTVLDVLPGLTHLPVKCIRL